MTEPAERLDTLAREATSAIELLPAELAIRVRRRHRVRALGGCLAVGACAAAASLYAASSPAGTSKAVRVATPSPAASAPSSAAVWGKLAGIARQQAVRFGDPSPESAEAAATNIASFQQAAGATSAVSLPSLPSGQKIYFIMVIGHFTCGPACFNQMPNRPTGTVLSFAVNQATFEIDAEGLANQPIDLSRLGHVHQLDLLDRSSAAADIVPPHPSGHL